MIPDNRPRNGSIVHVYKNISPAKLVLFLSLLLVIIACQPGQPKTVIGVLNQTPNLESAFDGFKAGMSDLGYGVENEITYIYHGPTGFSDLAAESKMLVDQDVDLILALGTPAAISARSAVLGTDIPVVFGPVYDPLKSGLVDDFVNPGGNITGIRSGGKIAKILELHLLIAPSTKRFYVPHNPADNASVQSLAELERVSRALGIALTVVEVGNTEELKSALDSPPVEVDSIFLLTSGFLLRNVNIFMDSAIANMLPISSASSGAADGPLLSYRTDQFDLGKHASRMANKILLGTSPADMPVESHEPVLGVNLLTARAINVQVPDLVIQLAGSIVR